MREGAGLTTEIFVLTHDRALFESVPRVPGLTAVDLDALALPSRLAGQQIAEHRFFLSQSIERSPAEWIGVVTGRWDTKFPNWPRLEVLPDFVGRTLVDRSMIAAPAVFWWIGRDVERFARRQDLRHPGMGRLLDDPAAPPTITRHRRPWHPLVYNNNFVMHRSVVLDWLRYWREQFSFFDARYGLDLPFAVTCPKCGHQLPRESRHPGLSYSPERHAGYFYEQVSARYFATRGDLIPMGPGGSRLRPNPYHLVVPTLYWRITPIRRVNQVLHGACEAVPQGIR